jgi:membrane protease YdiL (CAAX protease family)
LKDIAKLRVFITPPLFEEVDRAINYTLLILLFGLENNIVLILITSIIFAVMHFEILELKDIKSVLPRFLEYFLMGIILGVTMVYAGLAFSILLHALQNYISVISGKKERLELDEQAKPFRVIVHDVNGIMTEEWNFENLDNYKPH